MSIKLKEAHAAILSSGYNEERQTSKIIEYISPNKKRVLYLRTNQGFPVHADVMLHPDTDTARLIVPEQIQVNTRTPLRFSDHETAFPKRTSPKGNVRPCGKALYVYTLDAMQSLCSSYDK